MLYTVVFVFALKQRESVITTYISSVSQASCPRPHPTHLGHHRAPGRAPCLQQLPTSGLFYTQGSIFMLMLLSQFVPLLPPLSSFIIMN